LPAQKFKEKLCRGFACEGAKGVVLFVVGVIGDGFDNDGAPSKVFRDGTDSHRLHLDTERLPNKALQPDK